MVGPRCVGRRASSCVQTGMLRRLVCAALSTSLLTPAFAQPLQIKPADPNRGYERTVQKVANMINDERAYSLTSAPCAAMRRARAVWPRG